MFFLITLITAGFLLDYVFLIRDKVKNPLWSKKLNSAVYATEKKNGHFQYLFLWQCTHKEIFGFYVDAVDNVSASQLHGLCEFYRFSP